MMNRLAMNLKTGCAMPICRAVVGLLCLFLGSAQAQTAYNYTRSSSFDYYAGSGLLKTETVEPDNAALCVTTTNTYDGYGNKTGAKTSNCTGASGKSLFVDRVSGASYAAQSINLAGVSVAVPAGTFATGSTVGSGGTGAGKTKQQAEGRSFDPRFGIPVSLTGPNNLTSSWTLDDFGRVIKETRVDKTSVVTLYCYLSSVADTSSNSAACPTPTSAEIPADAVSFTHSELQDELTSKIGPFTRAYIDRAGRKLRTVTEPFDGALNGTTSLVVQDFSYNDLGMLSGTSQPYFLSLGGSTAGSSTHGSSTTSFDVLGRPKEIAISEQTGTAYTRYTYGVLKVTSTNDKSQTRTEEKNILGKVVRVTDDYGAQVVYQYDAFDNLIFTKDALQNKSSLTYDVRGRKLTMSDPDSGLWKYDYNAVGNLVWQESQAQRAVSQATTSSYDELGRMTGRVEQEATTTWSYDTYIDGTACSYGIGKLCESKTSNGIDSRKLVYDSKGRPSSQRTSIASGPSFASSISYDASTGRVATQTYPTGLTVGYSYTAKGFLEKLTLNTTATVGGVACPGCATLWQAQAYNAWGKPETELYGNGVTGKSKYETLTGRILGITAGVGSATNVENYSFAWNSINQLTGRSDTNGDGSGAGAVGETFLYDRIGRLQSYEVSAPTVAGLSRKVTMQYNALGSVLTKSDVGGYSYPSAGSARPHAPLGVAGAAYSARFAYDANGNLQCSNSGTADCPATNVGSLQTIRYTSFNLPDASTGLQGAGQTPSYKWLYDEAHQRFKETREAGGVTRTTYMLHPDNAGALSFEYEQTGSAYSNRHYLMAGGNVVGVLVSSGVLPALSASQTAPTPLSSVALNKVEYWHKDHLGSLVATTNQNAAVTARYAYDPFGKRRYTGGNYDGNGTLVSDWSNAAGGTDRGFTGHEHLDDVGVIHMNGRTYDPRLGMFMQPDPKLQNPFNLQNYNRYGYCYNNPTNCTDPTGQAFGFDDFLLAVAIVWGAHEANIINTPTARSLTAIAVAAYLGPEGGAWDQGAKYGVEKAAVAGFASGAVATGTFKGAVQGAFTSMAFQQVGDAYGDYTDKNTGQLIGEKFAESVIAHGIAGCVTSEASGGRCGSGALSASFGKLVTPIGAGLGDVEGLVFATVAGGTGSILGGGKFENGAMTAAFGYLFNQMGQSKKVSDANKPITPLTTGNPYIDEALAQLNELSLTAISELGPGSGPVYGTKAHAIFATLVGGLGRKDMFVEQSFDLSGLVRYGLAGSIRTDVILGTLENPVAIFDLKTGTARLTQSRADDIRRYFPGFKGPIIAIYPQNRIVIRRIIGPEE